MSDGSKKRLKVKKIKKGSHASEHRSMLIKFVTLLNEGKTRNEIEEELDLAPEQYDEIIDGYYSRVEEEHNKKSPLRTYVEIVTKKNQFIRDLERLKKHLEDKKFEKPQAYVAAIRAQSDMYDSLIKLGQDLNLIVRAAEQLLLVGNRDARDMDHGELMLELQKELQEVQQMITRKRGKKKDKIVTFPTLAAQSEG